MCIVYYYIVLKIYNSRPICYYREIIMILSIQRVKCVKNYYFEFRFGWINIIFETDLSLNFYRGKGRFLFVITNKVFDCSLQETPQTVLK